MKKLMIQQQIYILQEQCKFAVDIVNDIKGSSNAKNQVISVFTHEDKTVSVGFQGSLESGEILKKIIRGTE